MKALTFDVSHVQYFVFIWNDAHIEKRLSDAAKLKINKNFDAFKS